MTLPINPQAQPIILSVVEDATHYHGLISYLAKDDPCGCSVAKADLPHNPSDQEIGEALVNAGYSQYNDIKMIKIVAPKP